MPPEEVVLSPRQKTAVSQVLWSSQLMPVDFYLSKATRQGMCTLTDTHVNNFIT